MSHTAYNRFMPEPGPLTQNVFGEWVSATPDSPHFDPGQPLVVNDEVRRRDAEERAKRESAAVTWRFRGDARGTRGQQAKAEGSSQGTSAKRAPRAPVWAIRPSLRKLPDPDLASHGRRALHDVLQSASSEAGETVRLRSPYQALQQEWPVPGMLPEGGGEGSGMSSVHFMTQTVEWSTPRGVYDALHAEFNFTYDPCPLGGTEDGTATLFSSWAGKRIFCNPPYGPQLLPFLQRWHEPDIAVFLIPARTDTKWFHQIVLPYAAEVRFIKGRLKFGGAKNSAPFPSMLAIFRKDVALESAA